MPKRQFLGDSIRAERERQLRRPAATVAPFPPTRTVIAQIVAQIDWLVVHGHGKTLLGADAFVEFH